MPKFHAKQDFTGRDEKYPATMIELVDHRPDPSLMFSSLINCRRKMPEWMH
jgi:hypothetical protein